jgi:hypothetical protein
MNYVLTHYRSTNHGTVAQAQCAAESVGGQIINYTHPDRVAMFSGHSQKSEAERESFHWPLQLTQHFRCKEEAWEFLDDPFKTVFVGSDEILKFDPFGSSTNRSLQEYPTVFYLPHWVRCRKILLAGCLGVPLKEIPRAFHRDIACRMDDFEMLSVRDMDTWEFLRNISRAISDRTELTADPTWTLYSHTLEQTPLKHYRANREASSYHRLIALMMQHQQPSCLLDRRAKTQELAKRFILERWDLDHVKKQCLAEQRSYQEFIQKILNLPLTGCLDTRRHG